MAKKTIYLETTFWDQFSECAQTLLQHKTKGDGIIDKMEKVSRWNELYRFICSSDIIVDTPLYKLNEKSKRDQFLRHLLKNNGDGVTQLDYQETPFPDLESHGTFERKEDYSSIFLTSTEHSIAARNKGVINVCISNIWEQHHKFIDSGESIKSGKGWTWQNLDILKENSNGMVIVDNFILSLSKKGYCKFRYDLKELLTLLLPDFSNEVYTLSIFYYDNSECLDIQEEHKKRYSASIIRFVKKQKPNLKLNLELFPTAANGMNYRKDFHDRSIITNNIWFGSEAGFDLLVQDSTMKTKARAIKTTKTHGLYLGFGNENAAWLSSAYDNFISEARNCLKKYKYKTKNKIIR